jgi:Flp pilus assembly protein TadD
LVQGRYPEALLHAREAVRIEPWYARAHKNLGFVLYRMGLVDEAIAAFRRAIALQPDFAEAHGNLAIAYGKKGWTEEAMREMQVQRQLEARQRRP